MKKLHFDYYMQISYSELVAKCHYTIKCIPPETDRQHLEHLIIEMKPENRISRGEDSFGNQMLYGSVNEEHDEFHFRIVGDVTTGMKEYECIGNECIAGMYRYPSGLTPPGHLLQSYYESLQSSLGLGTDSTDFDKGTALMHRLYQDFRYEKNVTNVATTAEKAWELGRGVCQDYAHILIVLCRLAGIPARYVAGMLIGEGYSHAWVEILSEGRWYALDPTNDIVVTDSHIKLGIGRDAADCLINRGVLKGGGSQSQTIKVCVREIED